MIASPSRIAIAASLVCLAFAGCGSKKDLGENLDIGVNATGLIYQVDNSSCSDKAAAKVADGVLSRSLTKNSLMFSDFSLTWSDPKKSLTVSLIKITLESSRLNPPTQKFDLTVDEVEALLGRSPATIVMTSSTPITIHSNPADGRVSSPDFGACGLGIGGIVFAENADRSTFKVRVQIDLLGTSTVLANNDGAGNVFPVIDRIVSSADFYAP